MVGRCCIGSAYNAYSAHTGALGAFNQHASPAFMAKLGGSAFWDQSQPQSADPFGSWSSWGGQQAGGDPQQSYAVAPSQQNMEMDSESSSATSSDDGRETVDIPDTSRLDDAHASEALYLAYRKAKRQWRRFTGKPVRRFRRSVRHFVKHYHPHRQRSQGKGPRILLDP